MMYAADTHSLLWFLSKDKKLSDTAREVFRKAEKGETKIIISTIVLLELMYLLEKRGDKNYFNRILEEIEGVTNYEVYPVGLEVVRLVSQITTMKELHDRIIIATSQTLDCSLITKDEEITNLNEVKCVW